MPIDFLGSRRTYWWQYRRGEQVFPYWSFCGETSQGKIHTFYMLFFMITQWHIFHFKIFADTLYIFSKKSYSGNKHKEIIYIIFFFVTFSLMGNENHLTTNALGSQHIITASNVLKHSGVKLFVNAKFVIVILSSHTQCTTKTIWTVISSKPKKRIFWRIYIIPTKQES